MEVSKTQKWRVTAVMAFGMFMAVLDNSVVNVTLPQMQNAFHTNIETISWVLTVYLLAQAAVIPIVGYLSDQIGSKRVFLASLALFTASSLLCALAPTKEALIAFRLLQGIGSGALGPMVFAIIYRVFPQNERGTATAAIGVPVLIAPAFGPTLGGYLSTSFNWQAIFLINVPIGILALLLAFLVLPRDKSEQTEAVRRRLDVLGLLLAMVGFTVLVYSINQASSKGLADQTVLTTLLLGIAALVAFTVVELRVSDPVMDLRLFKNYTFAISSFLRWIVAGLLYGNLLLLPIFFENVRGETALVTGMFLIGQGVGTGVGIAISGRLYKPVGSRILMVLGLLFNIIGTYGLTQVDVNTTGQALQIWLVVNGLGSGLLFQPLQTLALLEIDNKAMARASSLLNSTRLVASALGVAVLTAYLTQQVATHGVGRSATAAGIAGTFWIVVISYATCTLLALAVGRGPAVETHKQAKAPGEEVRLTGIPHVISTLTANGEKLMRPEILLWHYPENNVVNGSLLIVENNYFCVLKSHGMILNVYETGQHIIQIPDHPPFGPIQLEFSGEPISWEYEAFYINRAQMVVQACGVALSREMVEVDYRVDYAIHIATQENAAQLVQHIPYPGHPLGLHIRDINVYVGPVIGEVVNQLLMIISLRQVQGLQMIQDLLHQRLQPFLSGYGITLDMVQVQILGLRNKLMKDLITRQETLPERMRTR